MYKEAIQIPNKEAWKEDIKNEFKHFEKFIVFTVVSFSKLPKDTKVMSMTWKALHKTQCTRVCRAGGKTLLL